MGFNEEEKVNTNYTNKSSPNKTFDMNNTNDFPDLVDRKIIQQKLD